MQSPQSIEGHPADAINPASCEFSNNHTKQNHPLQDIIMGIMKNGWTCKN
jgi:hypothetical protein